MAFEPFFAPYISQAPETYLDMNTWNYEGKSLLGMKETTDRDFQTVQWT